MHELFPDSLERANLMQDISASRFKTFVCPKCHTVYDHFDAGLSTCTFISFPHHPQQHLRRKCNTALFKMFEQHQEYTFHPRKVFLLLKHHFVHKGFGQVVESVQCVK